MSTDRILSTPPKLVGTDAVAELLNRRPWTVREGIRKNRRPYTVGYLGKIGDRHCWNLNELLDGALDGPCLVCDEPAGITGLCREHALLFARTWERADRSELSRIQFIAICRWVSERWEHLVIDRPDVWSSTCATPGCDGEANTGRLGPLCSDCSGSFYSRLVAS